MSQSRIKAGGRLSLEQLHRLYLDEDHPLQHVDLFTPVTDELIETLEYLKRRYGTWRTLCSVVGCKTRVLRKIRHGQTKSVSMGLLDRILTATGLEYTLENYIWFTAEDLVRMGVWLPTTTREYEEDDEE